MVQRPTRFDAVTAGFVFLATAAGLVALPSLPASIAIHFDAGGTPDSFVPRTLGVLLIPLLMVGTFVVLTLARRSDPPADERTFAVVTAATMVFFAAIQGFVLAWNLGYAVPFHLFFAGVVLWCVAVVGYAVRRDRAAGGF